MLFLYLQQPLGPGPSLAVGIPIMLMHRLCAAPWAERHAGRRCLWCGRLASPSAIEIAVVVSARERTFRACPGDHEARLGRFFTFLERFRLPIGAGIFIPLILLLAGTSAVALGRPFIPPQANGIQFRLAVALTVVTTSLGYLAVRKPAPPLRCPFPIHNLSLLGVGNTLWVFRVVGTWWLVLAARGLADA
ncbi:MAG: hypothetical protein HY049_09310 [Acidobacteria bacterium]|nr:hypothetical protein [Acidobacteriota bacterium]